MRVDISKVLPTEGLAPLDLDTVTFDAAPGEANVVTVQAMADQVVVTDLGAPLTAGAGCTSSSETVAVCATPNAGPEFKLALGDGDDTLAVQTEQAGAKIDGGPGNDAITGGEGADTIAGGPGLDVVRGLGGSDTFEDADAEADVYDGGANSADLLSYQPHTSPVRVDLRAGTGPHGDQITGIASVRGGAAADELLGSDGPDVLSGEAGADRLDGRVGDDSLTGGDDNDVVLGANGDDFITGFDGNDVLSGGLGGDELIGGRGNDRLLGGGGDDRLTELAVDGGDDELRGEDGADILIAAAGRDRLIGGRGADTLTGGAGPDTLSGGAGNDRLRPGLGRIDTVRCGTGRDSVAQSDSSDRIARDCEVRPRRGR